MLYWRKSKKNIFEYIKIVQQFASTFMIIDIKQNYIFILRFNIR